MSHESVTSKDGTSIAYWRSGEGPPLVLVHAVTADHSRWKPVLPAFEQHFTVCAVDRRGRGGSGDSEDYSIEREFEDIAAVVGSLGEPANLLGHSFGALCALEAALLIRNNVRKLVLYEPPINVSGEGVLPAGFIDRLEAMLEADDREGVVAAVMREVAGMSPEKVEHLRSLPVWEARVAAAHTIPRELRTGATYRFDAERFRNFGVPTLLLGGEDSPDHMAASNKALNEVLPDSRIVVMPGQGHAAMDIGTDLFTTEVLRFLEAP